MAEDNINSGRGFANMDEDKHKEVSRKGGQSSGGNRGSSDSDQ